MPRIERFHVTITTGASGHESPVRFDFNGHTLPFEDSTGSTESGASFEGSFAARSVAHSVAILGPEAGSWDIERVTVRYESGDGDPWDGTFGPITLDDSTALDIWHDRPLETFDV